MMTTPKTMPPLDKYAAGHQHPDNADTAGKTMVPQPHQRSCHPNAADTAYEQIAPLPKEKGTQTINDIQMPLLSSKQRCQTTTIEHELPKLHE
jgi:hypothetical protein